MQVKWIEYGGVSCAICGIDGSADLSPDNGEDLSFFPALAALFKPALDVSIRVLLTHYPPAGCFHKPYGSKVIKKLCRQFSFTRIVCGHDHDRFGIEDGEFQAINPGSIGKCVRFEINAVKARHNGSRR